MLKTRRYAALLSMRAYSSIEDLEE